MSSQVNEYDPKAYMKLNNLSYETNMRNSKAFDSNYSETGTWLDSKFNINRSGDKNNDIPQEPQNVQFNDNAPSLFNKNPSSRKLVNDYVLMGKVKNISFPKDKHKQSMRYSNSKKRYIFARIFIIRLRCHLS